MVDVYVLTSFKTQKLSIFNTFNIWHLPQTAPKCEPPGGGPSKKKPALFCAGFFFGWKMGFEPTTPSATN